MNARIVRLIAVYGLLSLWAIGADSSSPGIQESRPEQSPILPSSPGAAPTSNITTLPTVPSPSFPILREPAQTPEKSSELAPPEKLTGASPPISPVSTNYANLPANTIIQGSIDFLAAPLEQVLEFYAELTGRTILRPAALPASQITLRTQIPLTKQEAIQALDTVLALNGITMINISEKFVIAVPSTQALQEAPPFDITAPDQLPEAGQYVTKIIQLKHIPPSEVIPFLQSFSKVPNGLLPIDSTKTLIIRDYAANVKRMLEVLEKLDVEQKKEYELVVIPIKYGKVEEIYNTMSSLVSGTAPVTRTPTTTTPSATVSRTTGTGISRTTPSVRSPYSQSSAFYPQQLQATGTPIAGTPSTTFAQRLQQLLSQRGGEEIRLLENARIVPDLRSNSLIVYATKEDIMMISNLVAKVDTLQAQVLIEAIIMDVTLSDEFELGVSTYLRTHGGQWTHDYLANPGPVFSTITNLTSYGFAWIGHYKDDLTIVARALAGTGKGQIVATPRILTTHATPAIFSVGQRVPYITATYYGGAYYGPSSSFSQLDVTTELNVTPFITPDNLVVMEIQQNIEEISGFRKFENVGELPETMHRHASATVAVRNGDTIILGGYIRSSSSKSNSGVPLLKDIPLIGMLFRTKSSKANRSETIVLLKPTVLSTPEDAALFTDLERERLPGINQTEREMPPLQEKLRQRTSRLDKP